MKTEEEKNEWIVNFFGCQKDIRVIFGAIFVIMIIYFIAMCYFFCCGRESNSDTLWGSAANFGNMYGALGCLFSGLASVAMIATLLKQGESNKYQKNELDCTKNKNDKEAILKMISMMIEVRNSLRYEEQVIGQAVSKKLHDNLKDSLSSFAKYLHKSDPDLMKEAVDAYRCIIDTYLPVSAIFFHIVDSAIMSGNMNEYEKTKAIRLALHCLSKADNQLMRVVLSHKDYSHTFNELEYTKDEFRNEKITSILSNLLNNGMSDDKKRTICKSYLNVMHLSEQ